MYRYVVEIHVAVEIPDPLRISATAEQLAESILNDPAVTSLSCDWYEGNLPEPENG